MFMASSFAFWIEPRPVELKCTSYQFRIAMAFHRHLLLQGVGADNRQSSVVCTGMRCFLRVCEAPTRGLRGLICTGGPRPRRELRRHIVHVRDAPLMSSTVRRLEEYVKSMRSSE